MAFWIEKPNQTFPEIRQGEVPKEIAELLIKRDLPIMTPPETDDNSVHVYVRDLTSAQPPISPDNHSHSKIYKMG